MPKLLPMVALLLAGSRLGAQDSLSHPAPPWEARVGTIWYRGTTTAKAVHGALGTRAQAVAVIVKNSSGTIDWIGVEFTTFEEVNGLGSVMGRSESSFVPLNQVLDVVAALDQLRSFDTTLVPGARREMHYNGPGYLRALRTWNEIERKWWTHITVGTPPYTETAYLRESDLLLFLDSIRGAQKEAFAWH